MDQEIDLSGEQDPTERMVEQQENARERAEDDESAELRAGSTVEDLRSSKNLRGADHDGHVETEQFDVEEALSSL